MCKRIRIKPGENAFAEASSTDHPNDGTKMNDGATKTCFHEKRPMSASDRYHCVKQEGKVMLSAMRKAGTRPKKGFGSETRHC